MLADLLSESDDAELEESWRNERTPTLVRAVRALYRQKPHQSLDGKTPTQEVLNLSSECCRWLILVISPTFHDLK